MLRATGHGIGGKFSTASTIFRSTDFARLATFLLVGAVNSLFGYGIFTVFLWAGLHYSFAAAGSTCVGILFNFKTTGGIVFKSKDNSLIFKFIISYALTYAIQVLVLSVLINIGFSAYTSGLVALPILAMLSYFLLTSFVFQEK